MEEKYINEIEEYLWDTMQIKLFEDDRTMLRNVLYQFQQDIQAHVTTQSVKDFTDMLDKAFGGIQ